MSFSVLQEEISECWRLELGVRQKWIGKFFFLPRAEKGRVQRQCQWVLAHISLVECED